MYRKTSYTHNKPMPEPEPILLQGNKKGNKIPQKTEIHQPVQDIPWNGRQDSTIKTTGNQENNTIGCITTTSVIFQIQRPISTKTT